MFAQVTLAGRLSADPIVRTTQSGTTVVSATVVTNRRTKKGGEWVDEATFTDVTLWGRRGETFAQYFKKGSPVLVNGTLVQERWEQDGAKRSKHVVADADFTFLPKSKGSDAQVEGDLAGHDYSAYSDSVEAPF